MGLRNVHASTNQLRGGRFNIENDVTPEEVRLGVAIKFSAELVCREQLRCRQLHLTLRVSPAHQQPPCLPC